MQRLDHLLSPKENIFVMHYNRSYCIILRKKWWRQLRIWRSQTSILLSVTHRQIKLHCRIPNWRGQLFKYNNYFFQKLKILATRTPLTSWMQSGIPEGCALAPPLVTTMVIFLLQVLLFFLQLCHLLLRLVTSITVTMVITIPATVLVTVPDQHSQSTACTIITRTESLGMFFTQIWYSDRDWYIDTNEYELCPSSSRFILILIWVGVSSKSCKR